MTMRPARHNSLRVWVSLSVAAGLAGLIAYYASPGEEGEPSLSGEAMAVRSAMARIAAESRGGVQDPPIQAAPRSSERRPAADLMVEDTVPAPPDGYSFVSYHGEMSRARVESEVGDGDESSGPGPDWLDSTTSIERLAEQATGAGRDWTFGWVRLAGDTRVEDLARSLPDSGAAILGSSGNLVRARLPGDPGLLREIAELPEVDGLGTVPLERKIPETFVREMLETPLQEQAPVFITLMTDDPDGRWRRALEGLGAVVGRFDPDLRTYTANVASGQVEAIAAADFVLAVEPVGIVRPAHDTAVPAVGADALRVYDGAPGFFSGVGGASVPIGVLDSGLNINHLDIESNRESICGADFAGGFPISFFTGGSDDLWIDEGGHGTHVTGTMAGNGTVQRRFAGMAPSVKDIRVAKSLNAFGFGSLLAVIDGMDFLARATECAEAVRGLAPIKPLIVNMSLSASSRRFAGKGISERKLDSIVWADRQLYVVAQSNEGSAGFSDFAAAKSSLAVGATLDSGDIAIFSSHGPTADGRLAPQVVAPGVRIHSVAGAGSRGEYRSQDGTSMASPAVAGVAALLMDAVPEHREQPALARARLMAGALRPDPWLEDPGAFPATNSDGPGALQAQYGLGKVSARTSILNRNRADGWIGGGAVSELEEGEYAYRDIRVPAGASRLDLVMTWDEPPADAIVDTVLNDLDLWLDRDGDCETGACGEQVSASRVDNVEWIIVRNPEPGVYRAKVVARRVYTDAPKAALAWTVIRGASTPNLRIEADRALLPGRGEQELTLTVTADEYVAAGTQLRVDCRDPDDGSVCGLIRIQAMSAAREDGIPVELSEEIESPFPSGPVMPGPPAVPEPPKPLGLSIPLGEIAAGETQEVKFIVSFAAAGDTARLHFIASAWNAKGASVSVGVGAGSTGRSGMAQIPANDDFAAPEVLEGERGSHRVDLLRATPEPGEPLFTVLQGRPSGSVWYRWRAPADGAVRFNLHPPGKSGDGRLDRVDVFRGDAIAALDRVASDPQGTIFFAEEGETYRVRVSSLGPGTVLDLRWSQGERPVNDDFDRAAVLEGARGAVAGNSQGATLEAGEWFTAATGTTWYRWTAPGDGWWRFSSGMSRRVYVFEGDGIPALRLVSHLPGPEVLFPAAAGKEYRIAVAESISLFGPGLPVPGGPYELKWDSKTVLPGNDHIAGAEPMEGVLSSRHNIGVDLRSTVDPGEPLQTGVRTRWWVWQAPEDGRYTWALAHPSLQVTVFSGPSVDDLRLVARTRPHVVPSDFVLQATGGQRYWIAAGLSPRDEAAYLLPNVNVEVNWGPTPGNDDLENAAALAEAAGSVSGSSRFATVERGERSSSLGHSSLWWTYEAPASGWRRFWLDDPASPWVLAVYKEGGDGFGGLEFVRNSHPPEGIEPDAVEVVFQAEEGERYTIRMGSRDIALADPFGLDFTGPGDMADARFTLNWGEAEAPVWLKYVGSLVDGDRDANGTSLLLRSPSGLALNERGTALYAASKLGLQVFGRDPKTGNLTFVQLLEDDSPFGMEGNSLIWDSHRGELYAHHCGTWRRFVPVDDTQRELEDQGAMVVTGDPLIISGCNVSMLGDVSMDDEGSFLNAVVPSVGWLQVRALETPGELRHVQTLSVRGLRRALISNGGRHVYAGTDRALLIFERDTATGRITKETKNEIPFEELAALAISDDDQYLFVFYHNGQSMTVYDLKEDPAAPQALGTLTPSGEGFGDPFSMPRLGILLDNFEDRCRLAATRTGVPAADVFCTDRTFGLQWRSEPGELRLTDQVSPRQPDRFNNPLVEFGHARSLAASPDGRHAYVGAENDGILVFERVGVGADQVVDGAALLAASPGKVAFGPLATTGCTEVGEILLEDVQYSVVHSKWQTRATPEAEWSDVEGTETTGRVCAYTPSRPGEYRLVAKIRIDGEPGLYSSNVLTR